MGTPPPIDPFESIALSPAIMGGKPTIRGTRVIIGQLAAGRSIDDLLADYPYLHRADVLAALRYGAWLSEGREINLVGP